MNKKSKGWSEATGQFAKIAEEGRQLGRPKASKTDSVLDLQPHEVDAPVPTLAPASSEKPSQVKRTSTSLYLTPAAHRAIRMHAAEKGVRPHRIYDDALRAYFKTHKLEDFDELNGLEP
ncbi:hypothetical protein [Methylobacterium sp. Leaf106]|uniref:hypothetical protein n=1 Tax=Methylobacterium sp. Leaf106 TaxID=1736255 RepID=UPI0012E8A670|nr:hypothetical protein [Methylobacterium sp. Leaf106]